MHTNQSQHLAALYKSSIRCYSDTDDCVPTYRETESIFLRQVSIIRIFIKCISFVVSVDMYSYMEHPNLSRKKSICINSDARILIGRHTRQVVVYLRGQLSI